MCHSFYGNQVLNKFKEQNMNKIEKSKKFINPNSLSIVTEQ